MLLEEVCSHRLCASTSKLHPGANTTVLPKVARQAFLSLHCKAM